MEVVHNNRTERLGNDWSVMEHDDWAHRDETVAVREVVQYQRVPGALVLRYAAADCPVEYDVLLV